MRTKPAATGANTIGPAPVSHAPKPVKGMMVADSGATQQTAARTAPTMPAPIKARSAMSTALLHRMGRITGIHAGGCYRVGACLRVVKSHRRGLGFERDNHLRDAGNSRHRLLHNVGARGAGHVVHGEGD